MTTDFAKLMGSIKEIEIDLNKVAQFLSANFDLYINTIRALDEDVTNTSIVIDKENINDQNNTRIKENYKKIFQISRQELYFPLNNNKKSLEKLEILLNKIIVKINNYKDNPKQASKQSKTKINEEEISILHNTTAELLLSIQKQKQEVENLYELLLPVQGKINYIKKNIEQYEQLKKEVKIITQLTTLVKKIQPETATTSANVGILKQLDILKCMYNNNDVNNNDLSISKLHLDEVVEEPSSTSKIDLGPTVENVDHSSSTMLLNHFNLKSIDQVDIEPVIKGETEGFIVSTDSNSTEATKDNCKAKLNKTM